MVLDPEMKGTRYNFLRDRLALAAWQAKQFLWPLRFGFPQGQVPRGTIYLTPSKTTALP